MVILVCLVMNQSQKKGKKDTKNTSSKRVTLGLFPRHIPLNKEIIFLLLINLMIILKVQVYILSAQVELCAAGRIIL
jgi:hypothetical protein